MLKKNTLISLAFTSLLLTACNGSNEQIAAPEQAKFSLGVSDAPVDEAEIVMIQIDSIKLTTTDESNGKQEILIENFTYEDETQQIIVAFSKNIKGKIVNTTNRRLVDD